MHRVLTPAEQKESPKLIPSPEAESKEVKSKYEFTKVEAGTAQPYFETNRFKSHESDGAFQFSQFEAAFENGFLTISTRNFEQSLQNNSAITHALWIGSLNYLITVSIGEIKIWVYENAQFICKFHTAFYKAGSFSDVLISDDNQLIIAKYEQSNFIIFFHLLNKKAMACAVGEKPFCMPAVISSSQIALCDLESRDEITVFNINFDKRTCKKNTSFRLPFNKSGKCLADFHFLSKDDIIYAYGKPIAITCIGRIFNGSKVRIYHRNTNTFSELYSTNDMFVQLDLSRDKTQVALYNNQQFQLINLEKQEQFGKKLADNLSMFSMDVVKIVASYAHYYVDPGLPDARTLTRLPFEIRIQFQVCLLKLISKDDTLLKLYFLIADHPRKPLNECVAIAEKNCLLSPRKRWWHYSNLFAEIRKISTAESLESKEQDLAESKTRLTG